MIGRRRWWRPVPWLVGVAAVGVIVWWVWGVLATPPADPLAAAAEPVTFTVAEGTVERSMTFAARAAWETVPLGRVGRTGVVTSVVVEPGDTVAVGDVVFTVDLRPVVVAEGAVPAFRQLAQRDTGADVAQLQALLAESGWFTGEVDGRFGAGTRSAVRAWQRDLGVADDGVVQAGDVVFVTGLPARVAPDGGLVTGAEVSEGSVPLRLLADAPTFWVPLQADQASLVPVDTPVRVRYPDGVWDATVTSATIDEFGAFSLYLADVGGGPVCGGDCALWVPLDVDGVFGAEIVLIPPTTGPSVPVAALRTDPGGAVFVTLADGTNRADKETASWGGTAIVDGISAGDVVILPFGAGQ